jgi:hypothetical protein
MPTVMEETQPDQVLGTLHPLAHTVGVTHTGIIGFQPLEIHSILECKLYMSVMKLEWPVKRALRKVIMMKANGTLSGRMSFSAISIKVDIVWVSFSWFMLWKVSNIAVSLFLIVTRSGFSRFLGRILLKPRDNIDFF